MKAFLGVIGIFLTLTAVEALNFDVADAKTNKTCLFARMEAKFHIPYTMDNKNKSTAHVPINDRATSAGKCAGINGTDASLTIIVGPTNTLKIGFISKDNGTVIDSIDYSFKYFEADFPNLPAGMLNQSATVGVSSLNKKLAREGEYFRCIAPEPVKLSSSDKSLDVNFELSDVLFQVFDVVNGSMSNTKTECAADATTTQTTHTTPSTHNTTHHSNHTTHHSNHTTHHTNHTTHHTTHTTQHSNKTTVHTTPMTTAPPTPHWYVQVNSTVCIIAEMNLDMTITYKNEKNKSISHGVSLPTSATVDNKLSSCGDNQVLVLNFFDDWSVRFNLTSQKSSTYVSGIELDYKTDSHLPNASKVETNAAKETGLKLFKATKKNYFKCDASETQKLGDSVELKFTHVKFQSYRDDQKNSTDLSGTAEECADDEKTSAIVPIVVGAALAALVVIVLIAYLVGRRRRQSGYESV